MMGGNRMRLAISMTTMFRLGQKYFTGSYVHHQLSGLKPFFDRLDLIGPLSEAEKINNKFNQEIDTASFCIKGLPYYDSAFDLYFRKFIKLLDSMVRLFRHGSKEWDAVIIYQFDILNQIAFFLCKIYGIPVIIWIGGNIIKQIKTQVQFKPIFIRIGKIIKAYQNEISLRLNIGRAVGVIVTGEDLRDYYLKMNPNIHQLIASGARFSDIDNDLPEERSKKLEGPLRILTVSRLIPVKGIEYLLEAVSGLTKERIPVLLKVVGPVHNAGYYEQLLNLVKEKRLEDRVVFTGGVPHGPELFQLYREADVFVLPSLSEGTPKVFSEAMAKGLPIVASRVGGIPDQIVEGVHGFLVAPRRSEEIAAALKRLFYDPQLRYKMGRAVLNSALKYTIEYQMRGIANWIKTSINPDHQSEQN
jgi:glycosyltransferase involved in cell wall biosynthesis